MPYDAASDVASAFAGGSASPKNLASRSSDIL